MIKLKYNEKLYELNGFLKSTIDSYETLDFMFETITLDEKNLFMDLLNDLIKNAEIYDSTNYQAFHSTTGVDFSTDLEKAAEKYNISRGKVDEFIANMSTKYAHNNQGTAR